ncbi:phage holin family protein [Dehalobacterium formicoaceticum]|uniref:Phage holin family protein n=1 Tax=Dehalobacterium formicoaceticum TaxID=51515 RepID=A0ABT1Y7N0_9FIRM|nr:phage holin family protein [Dehalobacterium formicoaceticum]MCR6546892.1 phage holin family protein [Dehalobacterium formicoaceticum]
MNSIAEFLIQVTNLIEAEFTLLQGRAINTAIALVMFIAAGVLCLVALLFGVWGIYLGLSLLMPRFLVAFLMAAVALIMGGGLFLWGKKKLS